MCIRLLEKQDFYAKYVFWKKSGLKNLANSQNFANSEIAPGAFL